MVEIKKKAAINSAIIIFVVIMALVFGVLSATYISSKQFSEADRPMSTREVIKGTWNEIMVLLHIKARDFGKAIVSIDPKFGLNFTLLPRKCSFKQDFFCEDIRVDWQGNRLWFKLKNKVSSSLIIQSIKTEGAVKCREFAEVRSVDVNDAFSFILEGCTLQKNAPSSIIVSYHPMMSSPELYRIAEGTFTLTEE